MNPKQFSANLAVYMLVYRLTPSPFLPPVRLAARRRKN
jgi:hypothetical protein